jgi:hypothetical protein
MVTYARLLNSDLRSWSAVAEVMRTFAEAVAVKADEIGELIDRVGTQWTGETAAAAIDRLSAVRIDLLAAFAGIVAIDQALTEFGQTVTAACDRLLAATDYRAGSMVQVTPDGQAHLLPINTEPDLLDLQDLLGTQATIAREVGVADRADHDTAARLRALSFTVDTARRPPDPPPGAGPATVAAWWSGLSPAQRRSAIVLEPERISGLDGIPADDRDQASRLLLQQQADVLRHQDAALRNGPHPDATVLAGIDDRLDGLQALEDRLDDTGTTRAYLLGVDAPEDRAILSIGNPDTAANTLTLVPGMGSGLGDIRVEMAAIDHIEQAGGDLPVTAGWAPEFTGNLATIGWMNYDAPPDLRAAMNPAPANDAGAPLSTFEAGLRVTATGNPHETLLGHSYGSVVIGAAARLGGLHADDVIVAGSPGMGVPHAQDLGIGSGQVWATAARYDVIPHLTRPGAIVSGSMRTLLRSWTDQSWFGTDPTAPAFDAHVFTSAPGRLSDPVGTHTSYFDPGNPSLTNIARIAVGDIADVS